MSTRLREITSFLVDTEATNFLFTTENLHYILKVYSTKIESTECGQRK